MPVAIKASCVKAEKCHLQSSRSERQHKRSTSITAEPTASHEILRRFCIPAADREEMKAVQAISEGALEDHLFGYASLCANLSSLFSIPVGTRLDLYYLDDEDDWIAMSSQDEFMDAVRCSHRMKRAVRVRVYESLVPVEQPPVYDRTTLTSHSQIELEQGKDHTKTSEKHMHQQQSNSIFSLDMNELQYRRIIVQSAVTEGIRSLFQVHDQPNHLDYAVNEILYGRAIIVSAIEDALGFNRGTSQQNSTSDAEGIKKEGCTDNLSSTTAQQAWIQRHTTALETLCAGIRSASTNAARSAADMYATIGPYIVTAVHRFANDLQLASQKTKSDNQHRFSSPQDPVPRAFDFQGEFDRSLRTVLSIIGATVLGVSRVLTDVSVALTEPDSFSGLHWDVSDGDDAAETRVARDVDANEPLPQQHEPAETAPSTDFVLHESLASETSEIQMHRVDEDSVHETNVHDLHASLPHETCHDIDPILCIADFDSDAEPNDAGSGAEGDEEFIIVDNKEGSSAEVGADERKGEGIESSDLNGGAEDADADFSMRSSTLLVPVLHFGG